MTQLELYEHVCVLTQCVQTLTIPQHLLTIAIEQMTVEETQSGGHLRTSSDAATVSSEDAKLPNCS